MFHYIACPVCGYHLLSLSQGKACRICPSCSQEVTIKVIPEDGSIIIYSSDPQHEIPKKQRIRRERIIKDNMRPWFDEIEELIK